MSVRRKRDQPFLLIVLAEEYLRITTYEKLCVLVFKVRDFCILEIHVLIVYV